MMHVDERYFPHCDDVEMIRDAHDDHSEYSDCDYDAEKNANDANVNGDE